MDLYIKLLLKGIECKGKMKGSIGWHQSILGVDRVP